MNFSSSSQLAVCQRIHRVDHDRAGARWLAGGAGADRCVDDRDEEAKRLARASSGRDDEALARGRLCDRLRLMPIKG